MRIIKFDGKTAKIREDDWRKVCERFDLKNFKKNYGAVNRSKCPLCKRYKYLYSCKKCPFYVFESKKAKNNLITDCRAGCIVLICEVVKDKNWEFRFLNQKEIHIYVLDRKAKAQIRKIGLVPY